MESNVRKCFESRWDGGYLVEADYSQVEIQALAYLTKCPQLIKDLNEGVDIHRECAADLYLIQPSEVTEEQRRTAKRLSFMLQYGASANGMSRGLEVNKNLCLAFIDTYYKRYPEVKKWQNNMIKAVENGAFDEVAEVGVTAAGYPAHTSQLFSKTGRRYTFKQGDVPWGKAGDVDFSATEIKNYPNQGFATGDIVPMALRKVVIAHWGKETSLLINTVHDSIMTDNMDYDTALKSAESMVRSMLEVQEHLEVSYGIKLPVGLKVDVKIGENWSDMKDVKINVIKT